MPKAIFYRVSLQPYLFTRLILKAALLLSYTLLFILSLNSIAVAEEDDDENASPSALTVDEKTRQLSGIVTQITSISHYQSEYTATGKALSSEPLLNLRNQYLIALSEQQGTSALVAQLAQNKQRQENLYKQGVSAQRLVQEQQAQWQSQHALLGAQQLKAQAIAGQAQLLWGKTLSDWILNPSSNALQAFLTGEKTLLQITLPSHKSLNAKQGIVVASSGNRDAAEIAEFIAFAPQNNSGNQGMSVFLQTRSQHIRAGMNLTAWLSETKGTQLGVTIPKSALVWSLEQAIVYIKTADKFSRCHINHYIATPEGYFVSDDLKSGQEIVITGAQQLLSEELRRQIPSEDD
ncbi:MAG: hypothetical protein WAX77_01845 [Methylococcaceae bacterium]